MLYYFLRPIVRYGLQVYFGQIISFGRDQVPKDQALILAANHPTGFTEPLLMCTTMQAPVHNLTRGDFFEKPLANKILRDLMMLPVYRARDGYGRSDLERNQNEVFKECGEVLNNHQIVGIFPEGHTVLEHKIRPVQKGLARLAFSVMDTYPGLEVLIQPLGHTYVDANRWGSDIIMDYGKYISMDSYKIIAENSSLKARTKLTRDMNLYLQGCCAHCESMPSKWVEELFQIGYYYSNYKTGKEQYLFAKKLLTEANKLKDSSTLLAKLKDFKSQREIVELEIRYLYDINYATWGRMILLLLGSVIYVPMLLFHIIPYSVGRSIVKRKVKRIGYIGSIHFSIWLLLYLLLWMTTVILTWVTVNGWVALVAGIGIILGTYLASRIHYSWLRLLGSRKAQKQSEESLKLMRFQHEIIELLTAN